MGQNVGTPRIYVDWGSWLKSIGQFELIQEQDGISTNYDLLYPRIGLNVNVQEFPTLGVDSWHNVKMTSGAFGYLNNFPNYCAVLGHNFATVGNRFGVADSSSTMAMVELVNINPSYPNLVYNDGFSIAKISNAQEPEYIKPFFAGENNIPHQQDLKIGAICYGKYYDFPHSPDLNLTMTIENDGITTQQTKGGATLTNARYTGSPKWGDYGSWELGDGSIASTLGARTGRRSWNLTFSYLSSKQTLPINALGNTVFDTSNASSYDSTDYTDTLDSDYFNSNVLDGEDFFSAVYSKCGSLGLPFIFNPQGGNNNNPDMFAICRFDQNSLQVRQTAPNLYSISLKIRECW